MRRLILGTAGHIDHGKTELVKALTGVDTDRLKEEKERGITIDLGFAELAVGDDLRLGVVDVPGHEGFIRNMLAGATGMDVVMLVVAADEGLMPQTLEHLAIISLLGVERLVVVITKADLVDDEWLALVSEEIGAHLADTPYAAAPRIPTSARTGRGLDALVEALRTVATETQADETSDLVRLPIDRVFTVRGTGTVVTGTLWSGTLRTGDRARVLPGDLSARVRGLQVHARDVDEARAGERTAAALTGPELERQDLSRGQVLVTDDAWRAASTLTVELRVLEDSAWAVEHGQRVRVHVGTAERMARVVLFGAEALLPGETGWAQLRLEGPVVARARERFVIRSYSPVTTIGGGRIAEADAPKRSGLSDASRAHLEVVLEGGDDHALAARAALAGWGGEPQAQLPVSTGLLPSRCHDALRRLRPVTAWEPETSDSAPLLLPDAIVDAERVREGALRIETAVAAYHAAEPLQRGMDLEAVRQTLPQGAHPALADALLSALTSAGRVAVDQRLVSRPGYSPALTAEQTACLDQLAGVYDSAGLAPPTLAELPPPLARRPDLRELVRLLEEDGRLVRLEPDLFIWRDTLDAAGTELGRALAGRTALGPADFKDVLPVTRKHLLPILGYFDQLGITERRGNLRDVPGL